jgi:hypothetical protein
MLYKKILKALFGEKPAPPSVPKSGIVYSKRHPETQTDAKLIWTGLKHHLSDPENFHNMVRKANLNGALHTVDIHRLPIPDKLKAKYAGKWEGIHFWHHPEDNASVDFGKSQGGTNIASLNIHRIRGLGIHPEEVSGTFQNPEKINHGKFMTSLRGKFDTFVHEFTHLHDHVIKGRNIATPSPVQDAPAGSLINYYNSWPEVHARKNQLAYKMDKVLRHNPDIIKALKDKPLTGDHMARVGEIAKHHPFSDSNKSSWDLANAKTRRTYSKVWRQVAAKHGLKVKHE